MTRRLIFWQDPPESLMKRDGGLDNVPANFLEVREMSAGEISLRRKWHANRNLKQLKAHRPRSGSGIVGLDSPSANPRRRRRMKVDPTQRTGSNPTSAPDTAMQVRALAQLSNGARGRRFVSIQKQLAVEEALLKFVLGAAALLCNHAHPVQLLTNLPRYFSSLKALSLTPTQLARFAAGATQCFS